MQINGLPSPIPDPRAARVEERAGTPLRDANGAGVAAANRAATPEPAVAPRAAARPSAAVPAEAPAGTDPALWSVLTTEERAFFARAVTNGPLTYTKMMGALTNTPPAVMPRGGRMDVRV